MHETRDLHVRAVVVFAAVLLVVGVVLHIVIAWFFEATRRSAERADPPPHPLAATPAVPPAPRLEAAPKAALQALRREEDQLLQTYGWVDRAQGRVRIPISRALDLIEQKGLPVRPAPPPAD
jgi:hypothetical protein